MFGQDVFSDIAGGAAILDCLVSKRSESLMKADAVLEKTTGEVAVDADLSFRPRRRR